MIRSMLFSIATAAGLLAAGQPTADEPDFSAVTAQIQEWMDAGAYPGAGLWIVDRDGNTLYERYWGGYGRETKVMMASASKWLEAATLMALVDEGVLGLDAPIASYLPELKGTPQGANTLRQMFAHTSSLNHIPIDEREGIHRFPALLAEGRTAVRPGEVFHYGGVALATAARAIEVVTGKPWLTVFAEKIAAPCGMKSTATGHDPWTADRITGGDNFPFSNAADYMRFLRMLLSEGEIDGRRVLSQNAVREMQADQVREAKVERPAYPEKTLGQTHHGIYGLGEWRLVLDENGKATILCSTSFAGFFPWIDTERAIAGVFVARAARPGDGLDAFRASPTLLEPINAAIDAVSPPAEVADPLMSEKILGSPHNPDDFSGHVILLEGKNP